MMIGEMENNLDEIKGGIEILKEIKIKQLKKSK